MNKQGFGTIEIILVGFIVALVSFGGYQFYAHQRTITPLNDVTQAAAAVPLVESATDLDKVSETLDTTAISDSLADIDKLEAELDSF